MNENNLYFRNGKDSENNLRLPKKVHHGVELWVFADLLFLPLVHLFGWVLMAKELPYFRFTVSEWLNDDISLEDYELKGFFIDLCAYYWFKDCQVTKDQVVKRFSSAPTQLERCLEQGFVKENLLKNLLEINFLNKQWNVLKKYHKSRVKSGRLGGLQKARSAKGELKVSSSYKDKDKDKDKDNQGEEKITTLKEVDFKIREVVDHLNLKTKTSYSVKTKLTCQNISARLKEGFTVEDFKTVINKKSKEWLGTEHEKHLNPGTLFGSKYFEKYLRQRILSENLSKSQATNPNEAYVPRF